MLVCWNVPIPFIPSIVGIFGYLRGGQLAGWCNINVGYIYTLRNIWRTKRGHILGVYLVISSVHECEGTVWDVQLLRHLLYV